MTLNLIPDLAVTVIPLYPRSVMLQFNFGQEYAYPIAFDIYRAGSETSELEKLNLRPITQFFFEDVGLKPLSKLFDVTYFIDVIFPYTKEKTRIGPIHLVCSPRLARTFFIARRMDEKHGIEYKSHTGIELCIYKRRHWGEQCTECFDAVLETSTTANCAECLGTGFVGGYWNPVNILGKLEPLIKTRDLMDRLNYQENINTQAHLRAFPLVQKDDILHEKCRNSLWYINTVSLVEHGRYPVKQLAELKEIDRADPLYSLLI